MTSKISLILCLQIILFCLSGSLQASEVLEGRDHPVGHPRSRFPLKVYAQKASAPALDAAVQKAVSDWNLVSEKVLGVQAFVWTDQEDQAQIRLDFEPASGKLMGETQMDADAQGIVNLPIRIVLKEPQARGQTSRETLLFQVVAHELGHAMGLPHSHEPGSLMCCTPGAVDFNNPEMRDKYINARRNPDVNSVIPQLKAHYEAFWKTKL